MKIRTSVLAAILILLGTGTAFAQSATNFVSTVKTIPCPEGVLSGFSEIEGETVICGTVTVPVNYDEPDGTTIDLVYAMMKSHSLAPAADPVIYLHGGPGISELHGLSLNLTERFETLRQRRDVIVFDQRGVGYSYGQVDCKAIYDEEYEALYAEALAEMDEDTPAYVPGFVASHAVYGDCADALTAAGVDLSQYNTVNNARDVATLADALGYDSYNLYGLSYGTRLGLEVLRQKPDGLRSLVLDSVYPPEVRINEQMAEANEEAFQNIYAMCLADEACATAYPDLIERLNDLFTQLDEEPIALDNDFEITSDDLTTLITIQSNFVFNGYMSVYFPRLIHELEQGNTDTWEALTSAALIPTETTDRFQQSKSDIPFSARRLLNTANDLARQAKALDDSATSLAEQAQTLIDEDVSSPGDRFFNAVDERWQSPLGVVQEAEFRTDYMALPTQAPVTATLESFVNKHFTGADVEILLAHIAEMSDEDVEMAFENAQFNPRFHELGNGMANYLYFCNDDIPYNSLEGLLEHKETYQIPGLTYFEADKQARWQEGCERLPTGTAPEGYHEPVTGDGAIPVLVFGATNDTQTALSWARQTGETVIGAQYVEFSNSGHGAIIFSQCAKDIAAAFVDYPDLEVNSACTADLSPRFVLPDEPLGTN